MDEYQFADILSGTNVTCEYPRLKTTVTAGESIPSSCESLFFPGCSFINYGLPLVQSVYDLLRDAQAVDAVSLLCCGKILAYEPDGEAVRASFEDQLVERLRAVGCKRIVAACPNCVKALRDALEARGAADAVEVCALPQVLADMGYAIDPATAQGAFSYRWALDQMAADPQGHADAAQSWDAFAALQAQAPQAVFAPKDSCPDRSTGNFAAGLRSLLANCSTAEMAHNRKTSVCCGSLPRAAGKMAAADKSANINGSEAAEAGANCLVSACVSCCFQLNMAQKHVPAIHYLELLFGWNIDWLNAAQYMKLRFLFDSNLGTQKAGAGGDGSKRAFVGLGEVGSSVQAASTSDASIQQILQQAADEVPEPSRAIGCTVPPETRPASAVAASAVAASAVAASAAVSGTAASVAADEAGVADPFADVDPVDRCDHDSIIGFDEQGRVLKRTNCHYCGYLCAFVAAVENGRMVDLQPDTTRFPYDPKVLAGCRRWRMNLDTIDGVDRVNFPLKRVGERGSNQWQRVTWDEALDDIAARLEKLRDEHGPGTLASMIGGPHTSFWPLHRFMNLFGSPNNMGIGQICWNPRIWMDMLTFGWTVEADVVAGLTECLLIWGTNPALSDNSLWWQSIIAMSKTPMPVIVIDPVYTRTASVADKWLPVKPGTDIALALAFLNVIISEDLVDHEFVDAWCYGYDELVQAVAPYTPAYASQVCGIAEEDIVQVARTFANAQAAALVSGRGIDQVGPNVAPTHRAICCLRAITGNVDKAGACILAEGSDFVSEVDLEMTYALTEENRALCLNSLADNPTPLQCYDGYTKANALTERFGRSIPARYLSSAHPDFVLKAMETGKPYRVSALIVQATNPLVTYADTHRLFKALMGLDLIVVLEYHMTPTASIADYVLPAAAAMERPLFQAHGGVANMAYGGPAAVNPYYERHGDYDFFRDLGLRLGQAESWPCETLGEAFEATLAPAGMSWDVFCKTGMYFRNPEPGKHLVPGRDGKPVGFATSTGKIELSSVILKELGGPAVPSMSAHITLCSDETRQRGTYLRMITGSRKQPYNASMYMNNPKFRKVYPMPLAEMSQATADSCGFTEGECIVLATDNGQARFTCHIVQMVDGVVSADYGWWHPEWTPGAPRYGGIWESNINCLTSVNRDAGERLIGTWSYNAIDCVAFKSDEPIGYSADDLVQGPAALDITLV